MSTGSPKVQSWFESWFESSSRQLGWAVVLRGVIAVIFGVIALRSPGTAAHALVLVFAVYAFADGLLELFLAAQRGRAGQRWGWYLFAGLASIALSVVALAYPRATLVALVLLVGIDAIVQGVFGLIAAFSSEEGEAPWLVGLTSVLAVMLGVLLVASPGVGGLALLWTIGLYAILYGAGLFALGVRMLSMGHHGPWLGHPRAAAM
jgi:uncharacterized membrane protein HdeD (DUF308 family)